MIKLYKLNDSQAFGLRNDDNFLMIDGMHFYRDFEALCQSLSKGSIDKGFNNDSIVHGGIVDVAEYESIEDFKGAYAEYFI